MTSAAAFWKKKFLDVTRYWYDKESPNMERQEFIFSVERREPKEADKDMRWVRAAFPPKNDKEVFVRFSVKKDMKDSAYYDGDQWRWAATDKVIEPAFLHTLEWLDESLDSTPNTQADEDVRDYEAMQDVPPEGLELYNAFQKRQKETQSELDKEEPIWAAESVLKTAKEIIDNVLSGGFEVDSDLCQHVLKHSLGLIDLSCECDSYNGYDCGCGGRWFVRQEAVKLLLNSEQGVQGCDASKAPSMGEPLANNSPKEEDVEKMAEEQTEILKWGKFEGGIAEHTAIKKAFIAGYNAAKTTK
jgi:hypothetical protein